MDKVRFINVSVYLRRVWIIPSTYKHIIEEIKKANTSKREKEKEIMGQW